jgi:predicted Rossmann-fold nucleotide-binding protein
VEQLTWAQLGRHTKPIVLVNIDSFWEPLLALLRHMSEEAFIRPDMDVRFATVERAEDVVATILAAAAQPRREPEAAAELSEKF